MQRFGDQESGFSVDHKESTGAVVVQAWGFWDADLALTFSRVVLATCRGARRPCNLRIDVTALKPQREEGQAAFKALLTSLSPLGMGSTALVIQNAITKMQLARIVKEAAVSGWTFVAPETVATPALTGRQ